MASQSSVPLPSPFSSLSRVQLTFPYPTSIEPLPQLTKYLASCPDSKSRNTALFIKRDDCNSGLGAGGGNKMRKLEYVLADAVEKGADTLVTVGGVQSNHMKQTVAAGRKLGMETVLLPQPLVPNKTTAYETLGNVQLTHLMSATHLSDSATLDSAVHDLESQGKTPYPIPAGASLHPLGGLGYARCAYEIVMQEKQLFGHEERFDVVIVPSMSGSTLGGLIAGFKTADSSSSYPRKRRIIGVLAAPKDTKEFAAMVLGIARTAASLIGGDASSIEDTDFEIDDRWSAGEYGRLDERTHDAVKLLARCEGIVTDPVYSGKALTGTMEMLKTGQLGLDSRVLFLHTGGVSSVSAYQDLR